MNCSYHLSLSSSGEIFKLSRKKPSFFFILTTRGRWGVVHTLDGKRFTRSCLAISEYGWVVSLNAGIYHLDSYLFEHSVLLLWCTFFVRRWMTRSGYRHSWHGKKWSKVSLLSICRIFFNFRSIYILRIFHVGFGIGQRMLHWLQKAVPFMVADSFVDRILALAVWFQALVIRLQASLVVHIQVEHLVVVHIQVGPSFEVGHTLVKPS